MDTAAINDVEWDGTNKVLTQPAFPLRDYFRRVPEGHTHVAYLKLNS
jgi:hypothetical protein